MHGFTSVLRNFYALLEVNTMISTPLIFSKEYDTPHSSFSVRYTSSGTPIGVLEFPRRLVRSESGVHCELTMMKNVLI